MKHTGSFIASVFLFISILNLKAQTATKGVLFSIENEPVYTSEFLRLYNKNLDLVQDDSKNNTDEYLALLINYKLKLREAKALGFDKKPNYVRELASYKQQLAKNYMPSTPITEALLEEAYKRISNEVKASHILVRLTENASPEDTLQAYNTIRKFRKTALSEGFETLRTQVHNGKTVFGEDLGWFSGFKMVYPFENAAYNTPIGSISQPFKTRFGYHIVYVQDKRPSRGERTVAHIMVSTNDNNEKQATERIQDIYKKLGQGQGFEALAKQFSDDAYSAQKGGMLPPISGGQLGSQAFEDVVFGLNKVGDVSEPFKTQFGWHIVKLYTKTPVGTFQDLKPELEQRIKRDDRSKLIDQALTDALKTKYGVTSSDLSYFNSIVTNAYYNRAWQLPNGFQGDNILFNIKEEPYTYADFGKFLIKSQEKAFDKKPLNHLVLDAYNDFLAQSLTAYQEAHLEEENQEYAQILNEYREGLLLFDFMENTVWNAANTDTVALKNYYQNFKENYKTPEKANAVIASSSSKKTLENVKVLLDQNMEIAQIKNEVNTKDKIEVVLTEGEIDAKHQALPENFKFNIGASKIYPYNNTYNLIFVRSITPEQQQAFEDVKGVVSNDFQTHKENNLIKNLKNKYKVTINQKELKRLKTK